MIASVDTLLTDAASAYAHDAAATAELAQIVARRREPVRIAVAGMVKSGKSTILNALVGALVAPVDSGECTKVVTWYRFHPSPRVTLELTDGGQLASPIKRQNGRLVLDLLGREPDEVARAVVHWPAPALRTMTLIDTPGVASSRASASARSQEVVAPADGVPDADALLYLMRHLHASDLELLTAVQRSARASSSGASALTALAVLSRADEVGGGRIDSLLSARRIANRYREDPELGGLVLDIAPVAGLLAETAGSLDDEEFDAVRTLSELDRQARADALVSVGRFLGAPGDLLGISDLMRGRLLERFGLFGLRLASVLVAGGVQDTEGLATELAKQSGLRALAGDIDQLVVKRGRLLKDRSAVTGVQRILARHPLPGDQGAAARLAVLVEALGIDEQSGREAALLARLRTQPAVFDPQWNDDARRLLGGEGIAPWQRLGLDEHASEERLAGEARQALARWRDQARVARAGRVGADDYAPVIRSCELLVLPTIAESRQGLRLGRAPEPSPRGGQNAEQESDDRQ